MIDVLIYSRPECHLCDEMKALVARVARSVPMTLKIVDISGDSDLEQRYGLEIPVLMVNGRKAAKYRISEMELTRILTARGADEIDRSDETSGAGT